MKNKLLLLFLLISGMLCGQISITYDDFSEAFSPGTTYNSYMTPIIFDSTVSVFVGEASATAQYWDFSDYTFEHMGISVGVDPATAPSINDFPTSNFVLLEKGWITKADTFHIWNYKELQSDKMMLLGLGDDTSAYMIYDPPAVQAVVPLEYGATWTVETGSVTVDAFGTMKLPSGEYECLRLRWDNVNLSNKAGMVNPMLSRKVNSSPTRHYIFYSKQIREVNVLSIPEEQFDQTTVNIIGFSFSDREGNAGLPEKKITAVDQNFPNPFTSQTVIRYFLTSGNKVVMRIFDFLGREVSVPVNEIQSPGNHEVVFYNNGLSPGVYYYQIICGDYSITKKMMISR